jgi:GntR family transcriptional regulator, N-acetylglucosamine utilization regulator
MIASTGSRLKALEMFDLDPESITPHYQQLVDQILVAVTEGDLKPGQPLPSERELSRALGVSRMTVRRALTDLEARGRLKSQVGRGWFVSNAKIEQRLEQLSGFSADMREKHLKVESQVLTFELETAGTNLADWLHISVGDPVFRLDRIRLVNGEPIGLEYPRLPAKLCPGLDRFDFSQDSLYRVIREEYHLVLDHAVQTIEASLVDWHEANLLKVDPGAPALRGHRTVFSPDGLVIESSTGIYRGDRYRYQLELQGDSKAGGVLL